MSNTISFHIPGTPVPKGRPRSTRTGRHYTPTKTREAEANVVAAWTSQTGGTWTPHDGPVELTIYAFFAVPKSWSKKRRNAAAFHTSRPDLDNLVKLIKDALNGHAYVDDSAVVKMTASKNYTLLEPSTLVTLVFHQEGR